MKKNIIIIGTNLTEIISNKFKKNDQINLFVITRDEKLPKSFKKNNLNIKFFKRKTLVANKFHRFLKSRKFNKILLFNNEINFSMTLNDHNFFLNTHFDLIKEILKLLKTKKCKTRFIYCSSNNNDKRKNKIHNMSQLFDFIDFKIIESYKKMFNLNIKFYLKEKLNFNRKIKILNNEI
tara:strand:+ start:191 stop:727 length:537 start_codon:yes stop_codon:yes gene_type:complete